jgi:hypothetical protein
VASTDSADAATRDGDPGVACQCSTNATDQAISPTAEIAAITKRLFPSTVSP